LVVSLPVARGKSNADEEAEVQVDVSTDGSGRSAPEVGSLVGVATPEKGPSAHEEVGSDDGGSVGDTEVAGSVGFHFGEHGEATSNQEGQPPLLNTEELVEHDDDKASSQEAGGDGKSVASDTGVSPGHDGEEDGEAGGDGLVNDVVAHSSGYQVEVDEEVGEDATGKSSEVSEPCSTLDGEGSAS